MSYIKKNSEELKRLKKGVEDWHQYFKSNNQRFWDFTKFCCVTNISNKERTALQAVSKPQLEFNILESQVARLRGEFAKHSPSFEVRAIDGLSNEYLTPEFLQTMKVIEAHLLAMFSDNTNDAIKYKIYTDILVGGFSVVEIMTNYVNPKSFEQKIEIERVFDPTLCIFDPMARQSHKGDGWCAGKIVPLTLDDFKSQFGTKYAEDVQLSVNANFDGYNWAYKNQQQEVVLVADMYVKRAKRQKIVKLTNGHVVPLKQYEKLIEIWDEEAVMAVAPKILQERETMLESIERYKFCSEGILDRTDTDFIMFPTIFVDGNSVLVHGEDITAGVDGNSQTNADSDNSAVMQVTKPYIMLAKDTQLLMNYAGQSLASEMENIVQHQYIVAVEAVPQDQQEAYTMPQIADCLQYNFIYDKEAGITLPPPQVLERRQIPPQLAETFYGASKIMQTILGNYDAVLGINDKDVSGRAIQQGALQSNAAALPYLMGFNNGLNRMAEVIIDLIPKYYRTPRTLPIIKTDGKRDYVPINDKGNPQSIMMDYDPRNLQIKVEMGVSSEMQKQVAIDTLERLSGSIPVVGEFVGTMGLPVILDNLSIRSIDHLKQLGEQFTQMKMQEASQQKPSDVEILTQTEKEIEFARIQQQGEKAQLEAANKAAQLSIEKQKNDILFFEVLAKVEDAERRTMLEAERAALEQERLSSDIAKDALDITLDFVKHTTKE